MNPAGLLDARAQLRQIVAADPEATAYTVPAPVVTALLAPAAAEPLRGRRGRARYGWRWEAGALVPDDAEQTVLARIDARRQGGAGVHQVARELNADNVPTKGGGRWTAATVTSAHTHYLLHCYGISKGGEPAEKCVTPVTGGK